VKPASYRAERLKRRQLPPQPSPVAPAELADAIARAIYATTGAKEPWDALTAEEKNDFLSAAHAAAKAHDDFLTGLGVRFLMPGMMPVPLNRNEAFAMQKVAQAWINRDNARAKLVRPNGQALIGAH